MIVIGRVTVTSLPPWFGAVPTLFDALLKMKPRGAGLSCQNAEPGAGQHQGQNHPAQGLGEEGSVSREQGVGLVSPRCHLVSPVLPLGWGQEQRAGAEQCKKKFERSRGWDWCHLDVTHPGHGDGDREFG